MYFRSHHKKKRGARPRLSFNKLKMKSDHLKWSSHSANMETVFTSLYETEGLSDVTLVCAGGERIKAHRIILSACSNYFLTMFLEVSENLVFHVCLQLILPAETLSALWTIEWSFPRVSPLVSHQMGRPGEPGGAQLATERFSVHVLLLQMQLQASEVQAVLGAHRANREGGLRQNSENIQHVIIIFLLLGLNKFIGVQYIRTPHL